ncbi:MAG: hypothetical protein HZY73_07805 [Micropruina sp.]|nr:MAG: hypothetical protein HZY73_07805 [Micropruina sp.]
MSALTIDEAMTDFTVVRDLRRTQRPRPLRRPDERSVRAVAPVRRPVSGPVRLVAGQPAPATWELTQRGLAVVVIGFLLLCVTAVAVVITSFLAVPNTAEGASHDNPVAAARG